MTSSPKRTARAALAACAWAAALIVPGAALEAAPPSHERAVPQAPDAGVPAQLEALPAALDELRQVRPTDHEGLNRALDAVVGAAAEAEPGSDGWATAGLFRALREAAIPLARGQRAKLLDAVDELVTVAPSTADAARAAALFARLAEPLAGEAAGWRPAGERPAAAVASPEARPTRSDWPARLRNAVALVAELRGTSSTALTSRLAQRAETLALGAEAPRFVGRDTDGNEVDSALFEGQIVVYRFWSHRSAASLQAHAADVALLRKHWNAPVELVGVSKHPDRDQHLTALEGLSLGGTQIYEGPISVQLADALARESHLTPAAGTPMAASARAAFAEPPPGALVVVDAHGRVRARDLSTVELDALLVELVAEYRAELRAAGVTAGSSGAGSNPPLR